MKTFIYILILGINTASFAQITLIPDTNFEQALIDLGIDSDGTINGQVLTSDIENVLSLNLDHKGVQDLTGIEGFEALEILNVNGNELTALNVSQNIQLKELYCNSSSAGFSMLMTSLDFSENINLEVLYGENLIILESLNLKNGFNSMLTVSLPYEFEGVPCQLSELDCVMVDDEVAATNGEPPYDNWYIEANFVYSEDCILGISTQDDNAFSIHPNPAKNELFINSTNNKEKLTLKIFSIAGKLLSTQTLEAAAQTAIDVSQLSSGIYFLNIEAENGNTVVKKFAKQ